MCMPSITTVATVRRDMMMTSEMMMNDTMQTTKTTMNDDSECVLLAPAALTRQSRMRTSTPSRERRKRLSKTKALGLATPRAPVLA